MTLVALLDDHRIFSASLAVALRSEGFDVLTASLVTMDGLRAEVLASRPQVALLDRYLGPLGSGEELIGPLSSEGSAVVVLSAALDDLVMGRCFALGATACVPKSGPLAALVSMVTAVSNGVYAKDSARVQLIAEWRRWEASRAATMAPFVQLTSREASVLARLMEGKPVRAIAIESYVSEATIRTQVRGILTKLDVRSQLEAVGLASRVGWRPSESRRRFERDLPSAGLEAPERIPG